MPFDWRQLHDDQTGPSVVDPRRRLRMCLGAFGVLVVVVFARVVQLEVTQGAAFRQEVMQPLARERSIPGVRGRILARDGTVLAADRETLAVAVHYRWLEQPPDPGWLHGQARKRLSAKDRKDQDRLQTEKARVSAQRDELARRLGDLCDISAQQWAGRASRIQSRVERIAATVSRRRGIETTVAEELDHHVIAEDVPLAVVAEIEGHPERYPGVTIVTRSRRAYPNDSLAAHVLGHLGRVGQEEIEQAGYHGDDLVGRTGLERQYESLLRGERGLAVEETDRTGRILSTYRQREPGVGRDLVLTLDPSLQRAAETLLDGALQRRAIALPEAPPAGGAIVVMDVRNGAIRAAASGPRFDPNLFVRGNADKLSAVLHDEARPLFDRVSQMAIPPGSVFKTISAVALLEATGIEPPEPYVCQGYLHTPERQRCAIFIRHGTGHGEVTLGDALCVSCNTYFFHHAAQLGPMPLVDWALQFGFAQPTGVDLPAEAAGMVPTPATIRELEGHDWRVGDTQALAIGQGSLTATPLQVVRMMAAVANGGRLVTPHLVSRLGLPDVAGEQPTDDDPIQVPPPRVIGGLQPATLATIREGLNRVVADPRGTAHGTVLIDGIDVAGKTGTAETGGGRADHAWFAGYAPAEQPRVAFVVVLEHGGNAAVAAGPVAKRLILKMGQLDYFGQGRR